MDPEIVITGISGRFPESDSIAEFSENLFNKVNLLTEDNRRWEPGLFGLPRRMGMLKDITKFDSQFFGVHHKQAHQLDPQIRILLELTHECIVDSGYDPEELRGKNIGVFIGNCSSESDEYFTRDPKQINGYAMTGCCRAMFANRISYTFDFKGPSFLMDTACSSGALALYEAVRAMQNNECEAAIVGGANLCLRPGTALQFYKLNMLSDEGTCKSFDAAGNGYGRSEAIVTLFLQKSDVARRNYASIVHIKTNTDGFKDQGITYPSADIQKRLIQEVYEECKLDPLKISYVEAHGTGTPVGDPIEMSAISDIFCAGRNEPLLVGSVKSNMGHSEPTSGLCSVVKVLIAMEKGLIPPNLHFYNPNPKIKALMDGEVKIVTEPTPWSGGYAALSCFGFGGVNVHAVIKSNPRLPEKKTEQSSIPQLVLYSGRTEESVQYLFDELDKTAAPREFYTLLHKSAFTSTAKPYRGYKLIIEDQVISDVKQMPNEKRPVWYIFSGMGTQWPCMAKQLMNLEVFADSIRKSAEILKPYNLDLIDLVTNGVKDNTNARSIIPAFVSIAAVQVALVDVLKVLGIEPDGFIGHSVGELGCAYADGCFNAEQMILAAFWRGKAVEESQLEEGAMAALGLTWEEAKQSCPKGIFPSCHNAEDSVTISGPKDSVKEYVESLKADNVFAREVDSCGYAFHSQYIYPAAGKLQDALNKVIPNPKPRSSRWISSSYPENEWSDASTKLAGASYFVHNLVSPVLFHEALHYVPKNALVIEIAPHHLLQAILKRVIGPDAEYVGLMKRNVDNTHHLLSSIGRLYSSGLNPQIDRIYPEVQLPVSKSTPMISPLIKWDHSDSWLVAKWDELSEQSQMIVEVNVGADESADQSLLGHCIDGRCLYPATGYLVLAWRALAELKGKEMTALPVNFEEVKIHRATVLSKTASTKFFVDITSAGGEFEISEGGMTVCTGKVYSPEEPITIDYLKRWKKSKAPLQLKHDDIYKEFKLRGYDYGPTFQGVAQSDLQGNQGLLKWSDDWIVFLDTMLQFTILGSPKRALYLPTRIQSIKINPTVHNEILGQTLEKLEGVPVIHDKNTRCCIAGGVELKNLKVTFAPKHQGKQIPVLEEYHFVPNDEIQTLSESNKKSLEHYIQLCSSLAKLILEKCGKTKHQISDLINGLKEVDVSTISNHLKSLGDNEILLKTLNGIMSETKSKDFSQQVKNQVNSYLSERDSDILSETMLGEKPLRTLLDIVLENTISRKLKIAEVSDAPITLTSKLTELLQATLGMPHVNYALAHTKPDLIRKDSLPTNNIDVVSWDLNAQFTFKDIDFFVMKYLNCSTKDLKIVLENATTTLKDNGFIAVVLRTKLLPAEKFLSAVSETIIPVHNETDFEQICKESNLKIICKKSDSLASTSYLLRKVPEVDFEDVVIPVVEFKYNKWVDQLKEELIKSSTSSEPRRIWLVSEEFTSSGMIGLTNCLKQEPGGSSIRCIFTSKDAKLPPFSVANKYYQDAVQKDLIMNVFKKGSWGTYRHLKMAEDYSKRETSHAYLNILTRGDLSSLVWVDAPLKFFSSSENSVLCQVYYAPLNFRDVMLASGKLPPDAIPGDLVLQDCILGLEFSGRLANGKRVMGLVPAKGLATTVAADPNFVWDVPNEWTLEEASTVPVAYSTAYYALIIRGNLKKGERVLIHSGSGGVGQAAIAIALSIGCEVFTTVGSSEKKEYLKKRFTSLQDKNFCNSRDTSFEEYILNATNGEGVDIILNSLADEKLKATLNCLAQHGRFLEIGKYDLSNNSPLGMAIFLKNISFHGILLDALFENTGYSGRVKKEVVQLVNDGIADGTVKPLNSILYNHDEAEQAFRFMASGKHIGKVVLKIREEESKKNAIPTPVQFTALSRTMCNPKKSYIIIGGLGGFGLELTQWLVERGARNIVLTSRSGVKSGYQSLCIERWKQEGVNIEVSKLNVASLKETESLLKMAATHGPISGIFNLALVLRDAFMENQTVKNFEEVGESKIQSTQNLDVSSRKLCPELEWFVCFSSVSCGRGNAGQSNYGFANSVMERICEERCQQGLPGLAIQWGAIGDVGVIQDTVGSDVVIGGTVPQRIHSCLSVFDKFLQQSHPVVSSFVAYQPSETTSQKTSKHNVLSIVANIFGIKDMSSINPETSLGELGMDSLMGVEVKQFLERDFDLVLSVPELRQLKIKDLKNLEGSEESAESSIQSENKSTEAKTEPANEETVLNAFLQFSRNIKNELVPSSTIVPLNAVKKGVPLVIIHPIEGTTAMLESLAQSLKYPVYGVQCTPEAPSDCLENLAAWYWKNIAAAKIGKTINLAGYSFGASVAFEMAIQAERNGKQLHPKVQNVIMLDGSPALVTTYTKEQQARFLGNVETMGEAQALCSFALQFIDINIIELKNELLKLPSFSERVQNVALKISAAHPSLKIEELATAFDLYYKKLVISLQYTPQYKLNRDVTLIKAADSMKMTKIFSDVYDLEKVCDGKISVHTVTGTHQTFIQEKGASEISDLLSKAL